jgi:hypothetical protein
VATSDLLTGEQFSRLRAVAVTLIPGRGDSPPAADLPDLDQLLNQALVALGPEVDDLRLALDLMPADVNWDSLAQFSDDDSAAFELVSTTAVGAYFMSTVVLDSIGYPTGARRPPPHDLAADQLGTGILDPVLARESVVRLPPD